MSFSLFLTFLSRRGIDQSPAGREFTRIKLLLDGPEFSHVLESICHGIIIRIDNALFESGEFVVVGVVAPQSIDITRKGAEPAPKKVLSPAGHQLINHAVIICCWVVFGKEDIGVRKYDIMEA